MINWYFHIQNIKSKCLENCMIIAVNNDGMSGQDLSIDCLKIDKKIKFHQQQCMNYLKMFCLTKRGICVLKLKVE